MVWMDGWTASHKMKELLKVERKSDIPIIGLSGEDKERNLDKFKFSGMEDMIKKPATREELHKWIKKCE